MPENPGDAAAVLEAAVRLLGARDHSRLELRRKLSRKGWSEEAVEKALDRLAELDLQSDVRYAEAYARQRAEKGYGPLRIRAELAERGVERDRIEQTLRTLDADWPALAQDWYRKHYRDAAPGSWSEKARRMQAMARRGFTREHIRHLFR